LQRLTHKVIMSGFPSFRSTTNLTNNRISHFVLRKKTYSQCLSNQNEIIYFRQPSKADRQKQIDTQKHKGTLTIIASHTKMLN